MKICIRCFKEEDEIMKLGENGLCGFCEAARRNAEKRGEKPKKRYKITLEVDAVDENDAFQQFMDHGHQMKVNIN